MSDDILSQFYFPKLSNILVEFLKRQFCLQYAVKKVVF